MTPALKFNGVCKRFGNVSVLQQVSFEVGAGRTVGLVGENGAGKSTLMNVLGGNLRPDDGQMILDGRPYHPANPLDAMRAGVAFVHQELNLFANLTIAENLYLTSFPRVAGVFLNRGELLERARLLLREVGLPCAPDTAVEDLSPGERQLVEIARALSIKPKLIIFDEPTTSLSAPETEMLFQLLARLRSQGVSVIYISHILEHVQRLCDEIVVLRDGSVVGTGTIDQFDIGRMVSLMVGRQLTQLYPTRNGRASKEPVLEVKGVGKPGVLQDISFTLHRGEVLGISGLMGAGRTELARVLFGIDPCTTGDIQLNGASLREATPRQRIERGLAFLTEDRRHEGLCLEASIADNIALVSLPQFARPPLQLFDAARWQAAIDAIRQAVCLPPQAHNDQPVKTLSGGNQQKVVLAKWLLHHPSVLILDEPTRGVDVGAKFELYRLILDLADQGVGVLVISSELEELIGISDRILVMSEGRIQAEYDRSDFDREKLLMAALPQKGQV